MQQQQHLQRPVPDKPHKSLMHNDCNRELLRCVIFTEQFGISMATQKRTQFEYFN